MNRFRYALDPLCLGAIAAYALNRWVLDIAPLRGWFVDLLLIPAAAPIFLWLERKTGLRTHDGFPTFGEIVFLTAVWSLAAEVIAPMLFARCTADPLDVLAYTVGGLASTVWWKWRNAAPTRGS
ncbi:MAG: hypothetical protein ACO3GO_02070 [Terrimicrobiaceae bacterium]